MLRSARLPQDRTDGGYVALVRETPRPPDGKAPRERPADTQPILTPQSHTKGRVLQNGNSISEK